MVMMKPLKQKALLGILGFTLVMTSLGSASWADCQAHYDEAMSLIYGAKEKALNNEHLDSQEFMQGFQGVMDKLTSEQCSTEVMKLMQFVQKEQTQYPAPNQ